ncbi:MAG: SMP-30/gluconolactonase/LRE family protein [Anaerolineae bacterium]|nr:SMP-30/gluconolactonase/LRE family protein [Anaerolineae bacterium]
MLRGIQQLGRGQRIVIFFLLMVGGLALIVGLTLLLIVSSIQGEGRRSAVPLLDGVTVRELAALPDNDSFPAAVAVAPDGRIVTGSYVTGALWLVGADGQVTEIPGSRDAIGSAAGLTFAPDGTLYIVDQRDADPRTGGGLVQRLSGDGTISTFATINDERGFVAPDDLTLDAAGNLYVSDRGRDEIWRFASDGTGTVWWTPPQQQSIESYEPTGLAYDAAADALIVTDGLNNIVYRVAVADGATETLYQHGARVNPPGFDGVTLTPDGTIYIAATGQNGIARLAGEELVYVAGLFRGASDVDYSAPNGLIVTNFDSFSLVVPAVQPRLPFALDVVELGGG